MWPFLPRRCLLIAGEVLAHQAGSCLRAQPSSVFPSPTHPTALGGGRPVLVTTADTGRGLTVCPARLGALQALTHSVLTRPSEDGIIKLHCVHMSQLLQATSLEVTLEALSQKGHSALSPTSTDGDQYCPHVLSSNINVECIPVLTWMETLPGEPVDKAKTSAESASRWGGGVGSAPGQHQGPPLHCQA